MGIDKEKWRNDIKRLSKVGRKRMLQLLRKKRGQGAIEQRGRKDSDHSFPGTPLSSICHAFSIAYNFREISEGPMSIVMLDLGVEVP